MRVLLVADLIGGVRTFTRELAAELVAREVELHLALIGPGDGADLKGLGVTSYEVRDLRLEWMEDPWRDVEDTSRWIVELCDRHRPDLLHMNTFASVPRSCPPVLLTIHSCVLSWWRAVHCRDAPASWNRYRELALRALERADAVAVPTRALLEELRAVYGERRLTGSCVIYNGRSVSATFPPAPRERLVISAGRLWDEAKNVSLLARAAATGIDARVVLLGPGGHDAVECTGPLSEPEVMAWMRRAKVFAEPARYEPFGLAALEAALCGCALVLGDIPSLREVWDDGATFVSPDDPGALASAINALLDDPALRVERAAAARERAARYSPTAMADAYLDAYRSLAHLPVPA